MNDTEFNEQKARIEALIDRWKDPLGLGWWNIDFQYCREGELERTHGHDPESRFTALMDCSVEWQYLNACIRINMPMIATRDDDDIENAFVHELMHVFVAEMQVPEWADAPAAIFQSLRDHEERVVSMLARVIVWTRNEGFTEGRRAVAALESEEAA